MKKIEDISIRWWRSFSVRLLGLCGNDEELLKSCIDAFADALSNSKAIEERPSDAAATFLSMGAREHLAALRTELSDSKSEQIRRVARACLSEIERDDYERELATNDPAVAAVTRHLIEMRLNEASAEERL